MAEFLKLVESIRADEATKDKLFGEGRSVRGRKSQKYLAQLIEAAKLVEGVSKGTIPMYRLQEAMTTSDFPYLFGDIIDRQLLANYREMPAVWRNFAKRGTVRDFRTVNRFTVDGAEGQLEVVSEQEEYPGASLSEGRYQYAVQKYGRKLPLSFEALKNDDLDAFRSIPERFARAARRSESKFVTTLYVDTNGPHASFYATGNANKVTSNPVLSTAALQTAMKVLAAQKDADNEPIVIEAFELVVPPALEITARNILNALQIELTESGGTSGQKLIAENWMKGRVRLTVDPYIPIVASNANGDTSWFLFANPATGRPALEVGFLVGHEEPEVFIKAPNAQRVGGGLDAMNGDFDTDSIEYKVRHIFGGTRVDPKVTVASNGSGS